MKTKVIIENEHTKILLTPENEFEKEVLERVLNEGYKIIESKVTSNYQWSKHENHKLEIKIGLI